MFVVVYSFFLRILYTNYPYPIQHKLYKKKEGKYTKPYEYFIAMRNKELGLNEPEIEDEDSSEAPLNEENELPDESSQPIIDSIEADDLEN